MSTQVKPFTAQEVQKKLDRVLTRLGMRWPFFCQRMSALDIIVADDGSIPTLATDGVHLFIGDEFFMLELDDDTQVSGCAHEVLHVALEHMWRKGSRDHKMFNYAGDFKVNQYLDEEGFKLGNGWLRDKQFDDWSEEQIYAKLEEQADKNQKADKQGQGQGQPQQGQGQPKQGPVTYDDIKDGLGRGGKSVVMDDLKELDGTAEEKQDAQEGARAATIRSYNTYKAQGGGGGLAKRIADMVVKPKEDWQDILRRFLTKYTRGGADWNQIHRREFVKTGMYLPMDREKRAGHIVYGTDVSGSIGSRTMNHFGGHNNSILEDVRPHQVTNMYFDARIVRVDEYTEDDFPVRFETCGGGGTDFRPVFKAIEERGIKPDVLIMFTDTFGDYPDKAPDYPVIWASIYEYERSTKPPFGDFVFIEEN